MKKKLIIICIVGIALSVLVFVVNIWAGVVMLVIMAVALLSILLFFILNKLIKKTNWWRNQFIGIKQFVSNEGYRDNIIRNYDIVNLGSNPARYAFFYEGVKGQSWATGSQGSDMDFEILKYYHSYIKEGGIVLIPIMPFTAISPYLKECPQYWGVEYYSKFVQILDVSQSSKLPYYEKAVKYLRYPLSVKKTAILPLILGSDPDKKYEIDEQQLMTMELQQDATNWIKMWMKEFTLRDLNDVLCEKWRKYYEESVEINKKMVDFCIERNLKPVFICVPMTKHLSEQFTDSFWDYMVTGFVGRCNKRNVLFLDYTKDQRFQDDSLYLDSFLLNMRGRKAFTRQVLRDIKLTDNL